MLRIDATTICGLAGRLLLVALCQAAGLDIRNLGARRDKQTNEATAVQAGIDARAPIEEKTTSVRPGGCPRGQLRLCSDTPLHLYTGPTLWTGPSKARYEPGHRFPYGAGRSPLALDKAGWPAEAFSHISTGW